MHLCPSLSQVNALLGPGGSAICRALDACAKFRLGPVARTGAGPVVVLGAWVEERGVGHRFEGKGL